jgi:RHS repeat-associated protein
LGGSEDGSNNDDNMQDGDQSPTCPTDSPRWSVNVINMNLFVTDTPMWYDPPIGPRVRITLGYNSQSAIAHNEPFGSKWQFNYGSYLVVDTAGSVLIFMPDGRRDVFSPDGAGGYYPPYRVYNTLTRLAENYFELRFPDDTVYVYRIPPGTGSQQPFLAEIRDAYSNRLTLGYDASVHLTTITDAQGKAFTLSYNAGGLCTNVADPFGRAASFEYDASRNLTRITDMGGYWSSFTYDTNVYLTRISNERGTTGFWIEVSDNSGANSDNYPPPGDLMWQNYRITITNPLGGVEEFFFYGGCGCYTWHVSPRDYVPWQSQTINNFRLPVPKTVYYNTRVGSGQQGEIGSIVYPEGNSVQYGYDTTTGDRTSVTDTAGHTWGYTFNAMGRVTSVTDAKGTPTAFAYAANGVDLLSVSNGLGQIRMAYNAHHDLVSLSDRLTNATTFTYSTSGQVLSQVDALGITNAYLYDASQRLTEFRRAGQTLERFTCDAVGRVRARTDATGLTVTNDYNALNQIVRVTYPDGRFESYAYSTCCPRLLDSATDRGGRTTVFIHDALKRLLQTVNPEGGITQFGYDANGNRTGLTDPNGNVTTFAYDLDNRLSRKTYADGKGLSFRYDADGLLTTRTNGRGITTAYTYDANHNLLTTSYSDSTPGVTNTYDACNRLTVVKDGVGTNAYAYDANSRLASFDGPWADDTITYAFDALGRRTNLLVQGSQPTGYDYDALNRLTRVRVGAQTYAYTYPGASPLVQRLDRPNGSFTTYQYDGLNRLTALSNRRSTGEVINEFLYAYNAQDLRASETVSNSLALTFTNQHVTYDYNRLNQVLTSAPPSQVFAYDDDGNMTRGFTPEGNPFSASYDAENRLKTITVTNNGTVSARIEYLYAWNSILAQAKREQPGQGTNQVRNVRDGYLQIQERETGNSVIREYAWGLNKGGGIGGLISLKQDGQGYSYVYDGKGNVAAVLDVSQAPAAAYGYDASGVILSSTGSLDQPFRFSTKVYDSQTGLLDFGYRRYSPPLGVWLSRDPLEELEGPNLYGFVGANPVNAVDPLGLSGFWSEFVKSYMKGERKDCESYGGCVARCFEDRSLSTTVNRLIGVDPNLGNEMSSGFSRASSAIGLPPNFMLGAPLRAGGLRYAWANQYGSGWKWVGISKVSGVVAGLNIASAFMTGWDLGSLVYCSANCSR